MCTRSTDDGMINNNIARFETVPEYRSTKCTFERILKTLDSSQLSNLDIDLQLVLEIGARIKTVFKSSVI